jgi:hypothetical protein
MRRISMVVRDELVAAIAERYLRADRTERGRILDEFTAITGFHRKHAMRLLRAGRTNRRSGPRPSRRTYDDATRGALIVIWEASDRICGKRLRPLVPIIVEAMERHGHLRLAPEVRIRLLAMSAATIDRALRNVRQEARHRRSLPANPAPTLKPTAAPLHRKTSRPRSASSSSTSRVPVAQGEPEIKPDRMLDDRRREAMSAVGQLIHAGPSARTPFL